MNQNRAPDALDHPIFPFAISPGLRIDSTALSHGAKGYILKDVPTEEIKQAIDTVMRGERYLCTGTRGSLEPKDGDTREALTGRELTILLELAQGKSNRIQSIN